MAEFHFSSGGVSRDLRSASNRLYIITGSAALVIYLAVLPLLARLARRLPLPVDPGRRRALAELETALTKRELVLHYQPKTDISTGNVVGVEALVRWNHPRRGLLSPAEFLPIAESNSDLLRSLTCQVLHMALGDCARWLNDGLVVPVAVNVDAPVLADGVVVPLIREALERCQLDPAMLTIELTESTLMELGADITEPLGELRALGVCVSIDDFGTGHPSLARLRSLPLDELKVDRSFIAGISTDTRDLGIARHIVELGVELGLQVVAEGVEDEMTLQLVQGLGPTVAKVKSSGRARLLIRRRAGPPGEGWPPSPSRRPCA